MFWSVPAFASVVHGLAVAYTAQTNASPTAAGALFTGCAAGTVFGELAVTRLPPPTRRRLVLSLVLTSQLPAMAFIATPPVSIAALLVVLSGAGFAFSQGLDPLILAATAPAYRGRLFTVRGSGLMAVQGVGIALAGIVGTFIQPSLVICAAGLIGTLFVLTLAHRALHLDC